VELFGKCKFLEQARLSSPSSIPNPSRPGRSARFQRVRMGDKITAELKYRETPEVKMERITVKELPVKFSQLYWSPEGEPRQSRNIPPRLKEIRNICPNAEIVLYNKANIHNRDARILRKSASLYGRFLLEHQFLHAAHPFGQADLLLVFLNDTTSGASKEQIIAQLEAIIREDRSLHYSSKALIPLFSRTGCRPRESVSERRGGKDLLEDVNNLLALTKLIGLGIQKARYVPDLDDFIDSRLLNIQRRGPPPQTRRSEEGHKHT